VLVPASRKRFSREAAKVRRECLKQSLSVFFSVFAPSREVLFPVLVTEKRFRLEGRPLCRPFLARNRGQPSNDKLCAKNSPHSAFSTLKGLNSKARGVKPWNQVGKNKGIEARVSECGRLSFFAINGHNGFIGDPEPGVLPRAEEWHPLRGAGSRHGQSLFWPAHWVAGVTPNECGCFSQ
jgi:hypothetical protein